MTGDVIVIGAGIIGSASAYYLAKRGYKVIVLEKSDIIGNGGSSRNGGGVRQSGRDPRELPIAMYGINNLWPTLSEELGYDVEYHKKGNLRLGKTEKHLETLKKLADKASACGLDVRMIGPKEVKEINPYLSDEVIGASWCPTDGHANPLKATLAYYMAARRLGVTYITGESVQEIRKVHGRARIVVTDHDTYEGEYIVLAAGYESRRIAGTVGIDIPMVRKLIECLVTEAEPKMFEQMLGTAEADFYGSSAAPQALSSTRRTTARRSTTATRFRVSAAVLSAIFRASRTRRSSGHGPAGPTICRTAFRSSTRSQRSRASCSPAASRATASASRRASAPSYRSSSLEKSRSAISQASSMTASTRRTSRRSDRS